MSKMTQTSRRQLLATLSAVSLSGCTLLDPEVSMTPTEPSSTSSPTESSTAQPTATSVDDEAADVHIVTDYNGQTWQRKWEQEIIPSFEDRYDLSLSVDLPPYVMPRLRELVDAGDPPEVFTTDSLEVSEYIVSGETSPVDGLVADLVEANGQLVGDYSIRAAGVKHLVPHGLVLGGVLQYRADIYEELGLTAPETWEQLINNARAIDESEQFDARGFAVPATESAEKPHDDFTNWLYTAGGNYWRWADEDERRVELDFQPEHVHAALEMMQALAEYSIDPDERGYYGGVAGEWTRGNVGQCLWLNAWLAGLAYDASQDNADLRAVALNTKQAPIPLRDSSLNPPTRGWAAIEGTPVFEGANDGHAETFLRFAYEGPSRQASMNNVTMRTVPPYQDIVDTEAYGQTNIYQVEDGHFLELERHLMEEIAPHLDGRRPRTPAAWYAMKKRAGQNGKSPVITEMVRSVLVEGTSIDKAIQRARNRLQSRLEEGRGLMSN